MDTLHSSFFTWWFNWGALSVFVIDSGIIAYLVVQGATTSVGYQWAARAAVLFLPVGFALLGKDAVLPPPASGLLPTEILKYVPLASACAPIIVLTFYQIFGHRDVPRAALFPPRKPAEISLHPVKERWINDMFDDLAPGGQSSPTTGSKLRS